VRPDADRATWRKSSHSAQAQSNCVEVAPLPGRVGLRDTKNRTAGYLAVSRPAFHNLLNLVKRR